jgi:hypothetical protein
LFCHVTAHGEVVDKIDQQDGIAYDDAELEHRLAAQVIRDFMREYVAWSRTRVQPISEAERKRREKTVNYACTPVGKRFKMNQADEDHARCFINGEIDMAEFVRG